MFKNKKTLWIVIVLALIVFGGGYGLYSWLTLPETESTESPAVQTAVARQGDLVIVASGAGSVVPAAEIGLGFSSSGTLSELLVVVGEKVKVGQVIARLETNNTEASIAASITSAELAVFEAQQTLENIFEYWAVESAEALLAVEGAEQNLATILDPDLRQADALLAVAEAQDDLYTAEVAYNRTRLTASQANIDAAYAEMILAGQTLERAQESFDRVADKPAENLERAQAQSKLSSAQASYDTAVANYNAMIASASELEKALAEAGLAVAQAKLIEAQFELDRVYDGSTPGEIALAEAELAAAETEWDRIKDGPDPDEVNLAEVKLANAQAKLAVAQEDQVSIDLVAPVDGTVLSISANIGESVGTGAILRLADLDTPLLEVYLDETDLDKVSVGFEVEVVFDAIPDETFTGSVIEVDPSLETVQGVQAVRTLVQLDEFAKLQTLPIGLNASVDVVGGRAENVVLIPVEALRELAPGEYAVFVMENGEPKLRMVTVGLVDFTSAEITSGLDSGEIVTTGIIATE